jgi:hypothetical protein
MDFLYGGDFHAVDADEAFAAAGFGEGGGVAGGMMVGEGDDVEAAFAGEVGEDGGGEVEGAAGGEAGMVMEVAAEVHHRRARRWG